MSKEKISQNINDDSDEITNNVSFNNEDGALEEQLDDDVDIREIDPFDDKWEK